MMRISLESLMKDLHMRIIHCFPNEATRSRVMASAKAMGIGAYEEGLCIHFAPPKDLGELRKIRYVIKTKDLLLGEDRSKDSLQRNAWQPG